MPAFFISFPIVALHSESPSCGHKCHAKSWHSLCGIRIIVTASALLLQPGEDGRSEKSVVFHRKGWMKMGDMTTPVQTTDVSELVVGLIMDAPVGIGNGCSLHFRTLVGGRIMTLNLTGTIAYRTLAGLKGYRVGVLMDPANQENAEQLETVLTSRP